MSTTETARPFVPKLTATVSDSMIRYALIRNGSRNPRGVNAGFVCIAVGLQATTDGAALSEEMHLRLVHLVRSEGSGVEQGDEWNLFRGKI